METFIKRNTAASQTNIPGPAKKSLIVAALLLVLGCVCLYLFLLSLVSDIDLNGGRWFLLMFGLMSIPSALYTFYVAWNVYNHVPGYSWPQIFF